MVPKDLRIPDPRKPNSDGAALVLYVVGVDGPPLTNNGELNWLAHNYTVGRDMSGVHWRSDGWPMMGEAVAIAAMRETTTTYPERFQGLSLIKFDGTTIAI